MLSCFLYLFVSFFLAYSSIISFFLSFCLTLESFYCIPVFRMILLPFILAAYPKSMAILPALGDVIDGGTRGLPRANTVHSGEASGEWPWENVRILVRVGVCLVVC